MKNRELLKLAAKAAGIEVEWVRNSGCFYYDNPETGREIFDPLTDDGDAFRLSVMLGLDIIQHSKIKDGRLEVAVFEGENLELEPYGSDPYKATRRAIVRAAAEIGKSMKGQK